MRFRMTRALRTEARAQNEHNMEEAERRLQQQHSAAQERIRALEAQLSAEPATVLAPALKSDLRISRDFQRRCRHKRKLAGCRSRRGRQQVEGDLQEAAGRNLRRGHSRVVEGGSRAIGALEKKKVELYLQQILHEVESKAPVIAGQRLDYERALASHNELSKRLDESNRKRTIVERERDEIRRELSDSVESGARWSSKPRTLGDSCTLCCASSLHCASRAMAWRSARQRRR